MSSDWAIIQNPTGLELVEETTPSGFRDKLIQFMGGRIDNLPRAVIARINNPDVELSHLLTQMLPGDRLWWCRSAKRDVLIGNEGIAVVRDGKPIAYILVMNH
jgi:hypothetical protein